MTRLRFRCYAKVNLTLEVIRRRDDGYHDLASVVHTIDLADELQLDLATSLITRVDGLDLVAETNLVSHAARLLASAVNRSAQAELSLFKHIPVAAGLGGGSSDAATTLVGLNTLWGLGLAPTVLGRLAARLGSDVPFFIDGGAALMTGRGEQLECLPPLRGQWLIVVAPPHALAAKTAALYAALEPSDFSDGTASRSAAARLKQRLPLVEGNLLNAFTSAALRLFPGLADTWEAAERICGRRFFLSGAGPALFALALDRADAHRQRRTLARSGLAAFSARTVGHARGALPSRQALPSVTLSRDPRAQCLVVQW